MPPVCEVAPLLRDFIVNVLCCVVFVSSFATHNKTALNGTKLLGSLSSRCYIQQWCLFVAITNITIAILCHHAYAFNFNFFHFQGPLHPSPFTLHFTHNFILILFFLLFDLQLYYSLSMTLR